MCWERRPWSSAVRKEPEMAYQASEKLTWWQQIKALLWGVYTQLRSIAMIFSHSWHKRDVIAYPEVKPYLPPRYRGRIVLTRDPDGEERCVDRKSTRLKSSH